MSSQNISQSLARLGCCYYPEHWPESSWQDDASRMAAAGLSIVRIGEFSWSRIEPKPEQLDWHWLDRAMDVLHEYQLKVVLGTPTATPPRWMLDKHPNMLAVDREGRTRGFGSRRHYCFSYLPYRQESARITQLMAERYANHPALAAWQTDNEYGCHDTTLSYSDSARKGFRVWLRNRYQDINELNEKWGNIFWSMEYGDFEQIDLPNLTVTEANPIHELEFRRYSSEQVVAFNLEQAVVLRQFSDAPLIHNYMGRITDFDHYQVGADLDIASWDSYPLGFLEDRSDSTEEHILDYYQQGDPDFQAFHHDLYRAVGRGRWWVMEQQPGPVNWAPHNPAPLAGMVRLWTWEAFAHAAEAVCYFRWRQAPFAQEQMHAGLLESDSQEAPALDEIRQVVKEIESLGELRPHKAEVGLLFDYESCWAWEVQPQGASFDYFALVLDIYRGLRRLGLSVDICAPTAQGIEGYKLLIVPGLMHWPPALLQQIESYPGAVLLGPRSGSKTEHFSIPTSMLPAFPMLDAQVRYVESLRDGVRRSLKQGGGVVRWLEHIQTKERAVEELSDGTPVVLNKNNFYYLAAWLDRTAMNRVLSNICTKSGIELTLLPKGVRIRDTEKWRFIINYGAQPAEYEGQRIGPAGVVWQAIK